MKFYRILVESRKKNIPGEAKNSSDNLREDLSDFFLALERELKGSCLLPSMKCCRIIFDLYVYIQCALVLAFSLKRHTNFEAWARLTLLFSFHRLENSSFVKVK